MAELLGPWANGAALEAIMRRRPGENVRLRVSDGEVFEGVPDRLFTTAGRLYVGVGGWAFPVDELTLIEIGLPEFQPLNDAPPVIPFFMIRALTHEG